MDSFLRVENRMRTHSVRRRARQSEAAIQARKEREKSKTAEYIALTDDVISRKNKDWSKEAFHITQRLLQVNPEFTLTPNQINDLLANELTLTTEMLRDHPKVYWLWNHRRWCLQNIPDGPLVDGQPSRQWMTASWDKELAVVEKMLNTDPRNFMAWGYRRYVLASMPVQRRDTAELEYTSRKISATFSNFKFELVYNAIYTDPEDQSAWIYHRWLIGSGNNEDQLRREIAVIEELLSEQPNSKWSIDSLVYYNKVLLEKHRPYDVELRRKCVTMLQQLEVIDPPRRFRYQELGKGLIPYWMKTQLKQLRSR
ncbi:hypothetical protein SCLCIDRAFT_18266 [Scleroderma citrinum Foug A]|uniref:Geranylgeranyl transferase type-2 subunit alpha n=1 Tax=Scleroderma citrinum Foug A TaxID=1036808 RepID=A0A0C2YQZ5_9AGAM|nr:hypothetical protein SCLCIDRAFT_18266 [Scleroderma citrinum Foug A]